jgi:hypothetical protein
VSFYIDKEKIESENDNANANDDAGDEEGTKKKAMFIEDD